ncbi:hypothetical protein P3X46_000522 [Hevea brasiliensis]|uniref:Glycine-rich protein n=1 Tax=Hevea brasiliensis TaxID=3981 RepID=A0ABQ9NA85_HEVBR|nr:uncharacterized protein LOC110644314 [Hevea brasiliensis]KAJ9189198.1 hypothetical protein P3X46_000522 [Hevea brasiliensis]
MGFKKLGLFFLVIMILFQIHLHVHLLHAHPLQNTSTAATDFHQEPNSTDQKISRDKGMTGKFEVAKGLQRLVSVNRRGGGGGGHGGGGHGGGHASHSTGSSAHGGKINGHEGYRHGSTVVPLYAAGAMSHHQNNNHQRHGSNEGSQSYAGSSYLVLAALAVIFTSIFR